MSAHSLLGSRGQAVEKSSKINKRTLDKNENPRKHKELARTNANSTARKNGVHRWDARQRARKEGRKECGNARDSREGSNSLKRRAVFFCRARDEAGRSTTFLSFENSKSVEWRTIKRMREER